MATTLIRKPRTHTLSLETLSVETFSPQSAKVERVWAAGLTVTNCPVTLADSNCSCCSHPFTCPCGV